MESYERFAAYAKQLWVFSAEQTKEELDRVIAEKGARGALEWVRSKIETDLPPPADMEGLPGIGLRTLREYDFAPWFQRMQLVRLLPYLAKRSGDSAVVSFATSLLAQLMEQRTDPCLGRCAANALADPPRTGVVTGEEYALPQVSHFDNQETHQPLGVFLFYGSAGESDYKDVPGTTDAKAAIDALQVSLFPLIKDDSEATRVLADVLEHVRKVNWTAEDIILHQIRRMPEFARYESVYLQIAVDPKDESYDRQAALSMVTDTGHLPEVRQAFDANLPKAAGADPDTRGVFLTALPLVYPNDKGYSDQVAQFVADASEGQRWRAASASVLLKYYATAFRAPEYQATLTKYLCELGASDQEIDVDNFESLGDQIASKHLTEFMPLFRDAVAKVRAGLSPDADPAQCSRLVQWQRLLDRMTGDAHTPHPPGDDPR